ncbi:hypothetical protein ACFPA8_01495 [Streptomyces ovatisporus]|uniref:Secreted protein n=1 Tax=Streptomyces ovatisporus TaxID=1128682 RepID=A0ABV9A1S1_9ACTN
MTLTSPTHTAVTQLLPLAKDLDENKVTPGVLGFVVFAAMGLAVWMLMKSMHRHMNKVDFEEQPVRADEDGRSSAPSSPSASSSARSASAPAASSRSGKDSDPGL